MSIEQNKAIVRRYLEEGDYSILGANCSLAMKVPPPILEKRVSVY